MANTNNTNIPAFLTDKGDRALWTAARSSAATANRHGIKVTAVLARLAASLVLSGSNLTELMSAVAQDEELSAHGVKADSLRAYRAPLRNLAKCLPADAYAALTMGDAAVNPVTARDWALGKNGSADEIMSAYNIDRAKLAADMSAIMATRSPATSPKAKSTSPKDKGTGDPMAVAHDALAALAAMVKRGETTARGRRAMMVSLRASIDELVNACKDADRADADRCIKA